MALPRLAAQFYTLRDFTKTAKDLHETLLRVRAMGYRWVQLSAVGAIDGDSPEVSADELAKWLAELDLGVCATHRPWKRLRDFTREEIEFHRKICCAYVAIGGTLWDFGKEADDYRRFLGELGPVFDRLSAAGLQFGVHNHADEFNDYEGRPVWNILWNEGPKTLQAEVDTYWVKVGGYEPASILAELSGRISAIHIKDFLPGANEPEMMAIGEGLFNWHEIFASALHHGCNWLIVEQDVCPRDPFDCLQASFANAKTILGETIRETLKLRQYLPSGKDLEMARQLRYDQLRKPLDLTLEAEPAQEPNGNLRLGAFFRGEMLATLRITPEPDSSGTIWRMRQVATQEDFKGMGIGSALVSFSENAARENGGRRMILAARVTAIPFYEKLGYTASGEVFEEVTIPHRMMHKDL